MTPELNALLGAYVSSFASSLIMNTYIFESSHKKLKKESLRKLKYKDKMCSLAKLELKYIDIDHAFDMAGLFLLSIIPVNNVLLTYTNIDKREENDLYTYESYCEIVDRANEIEDENRIKNVEMLKEIRKKLEVLPKDLDLDDNNTRLNVAETKRVLKLNKLNYDVEMLRYEKDHKLV